MADESIQDDKGQYVVPFILERLKLHQQRHANSKPSPPFFIGLNGVQGAGKSVLVSILKTTLTSPPYDLSTVVFSLDDLYLTHADQVALAKANPDNPLLQHRGQPSTHDIPLAREVFASLKQNKPTAIPVYNKAAFSGQGDRVPSDEWEVVNTDPSQPVRVVLFEGWCVGFRPLADEEVAAKHRAAVDALKSDPAAYTGRLGHNGLSSLTTINTALQESYDKITDQLDAFVHIDAADPLYVYKWRLQQEEGLRRAKGSGMTDQEVKKFVDGYYPAYELYTDTLRQGVFRPRDTSGETSSNDGDWEGRQLRLVVDEHRKVKEVVKI